MTRLAPLLALVVLLAACGGSGSGSTTATTAAPPDPAATLRKLVTGAPDSMQLLTPASRTRVSPSELSEGVAAFADDAPVQARELGGGWAVAWTVGEHTAEGMTERMAYAVPLRLVGGRWLADIDPRFTLRPLGPDPGETVGPAPQVAVEIRAPKPIVETALLVGGQPIDTRAGGPSSSFISIYGAPLNPLLPGRYVAVAFARAGDTAGAHAWPFSVKA